MSFEMPPDPGGRQAVRTGRRRARALLPTALIVAALLILFAIFTNFYTDLLWFRSVDYTSVFRRQLSTKGLLFIFFGLLMAAIIAANFVIAYRTRPFYAPMSQEQQNLERYRQAVEPFRRYITIGVTVVVALFAGSAAAGRWETFLLWRNGVEFGVDDPQFGIDVSFYAFSLPWWRFVLGFAFAAVALGLIVAAVTHYLYGGLRLQGGSGERTTPAARVHLAVLLGIFVLLKAIAYWLDRYSLAVKDGRVGRSDFTGLTYTDINAVLPAKAILAIISLICAILFFATVFRRTWLLPGIGVGLLVVCAILIGAVYPAIVQAVSVRPSEPVKEGPYIKRNIDATRTAYDIADAEVADYQGNTEITPGIVNTQSGTIPGVRLLDPAVVSPTFQALQQIRDFYAFPDSLDIDRYQIGGVTSDTVVSVRELDLAKIPEQQRNWNNDHLVYTHGFGFVAARGNTRQDDGKPVFVESNIPPQGQLNVEQPRIYFGERSPDYSIVGGPQGGRQVELDYPDDQAENGQANTTYNGDGGVPIGNFFNKLLYAVKFQEEKIILSDLVNPDSKILYIRSPRERVEKVAPWLKLDGDPYPAVVDGRIVWLLDGYTTVNGYPYSKRTTLESATRDTLTQTTGSVVAQPEEQVNYIRNSVKATVDAYNGTVTLYAWDESDPVLKAWRKAFPGTVKDRSEISDHLLAHMRYPEDLFKVQRTLLAQYHVTEPQAFYGGQDFWRIPDDPTTDVSSPQPPYYVTLQMPDQRQPTFSLTTTFVPRGRPNLSAFAAVNAQPGPDYGKIRVLELPRNTAVPGPGQVQNNFEANTEVASQLSLLRRGGSEVVLGNLLTIPVGNGLLYVEPVYVRAAGSESSYPLLQKVLVAFGDKIAFENSLPEALASLFQGGTTGTPPQTPQQPTQPEPGGTGNATLTRALAEAQAALSASQEALRAGDFAKYGEEQAKLAAAIERAVAAQRAAVAPSPSPSPSATPSPSPTQTGTALGRR